MPPPIMTTFGGSDPVVGDMTGFERDEMYDADTKRGVGSGDDEQVTGKPSTVKDERKAGVRIY